MDLRAGYYSLRIAVDDQESNITMMSDDSSSDSDVPPELLTTEEEKRGTVPGSRTATSVALGLRTAQSNPLVPRGPIQDWEKVLNKKQRQLIKLKQDQKRDAPVQTDNIDSSSQEGATGGHQSATTPRSPKKKSDSRTGGKKSSKKSPPKSPKK